MILEQVISKTKLKLNEVSKAPSTRIQIFMNPQLFFPDSNMSLSTVAYSWRADSRIPGFFVRFFVRIYDPRSEKFQIKGYDCPQS